MRQAFLEVDGRPVLREVVLDASPSGTMTQAYRNQLQHCAATVQARANG
jgi:hypothetical protein